MNTKESKNTDQQTDHEYPNDVNGKVVVGIGRIVMRVERRERLGDVLVTLAASREPVIRMHARGRIVLRKVLVRRMTVRASSSDGQAEMQRLPVEAIPECRHVVLVAMTAILCRSVSRIVGRRVDDSVGRMAIHADGTFFVLLPCQAMRALRLPVL